MSTKFTRRSVIKASLAAGTIGVFSPSVLRAQSSFPERPITVIVPFSPGGYVDRYSRAFAPFLQEVLGQPMSIVNRAGGSGLLGHQYFLQQPDDGYTILCTAAAPFIPLNILLTDAPFELSDFQMVNLPSRDYTLLATAADSDVMSAQEVIDKLKADPGSLSIGIQPASADFVNLMLLVDANGISRDGLRIVTFDGGGPTRNAAAGGVVDISLVGGEGFLPLAEMILPLLVFDDAPRDAWDVPIAGDVGVAEFVSGSLRGWALSSGLVEAKPQISETLIGAIETATKNPACIEALQSQQLATGWFGPENSQAAFERTAITMQKYSDLLSQA